MDCVIGYHMNPATCGVAKFNSVLAQHQRVPMLSVFDDAVFAFREPLLSLKVSEFTLEALAALDRRLGEMLESQSVRIFLHQFSDSEIERKMLRSATTVYCGNGELRAQIASLRPDAVELWCPGTILNHDRFRPVELTLFSFGMAHKIRSDYYVRLHGLLEQTRKSYALYLSTALHEDRSFDDSFDGVFDDLRSVFKEKIHFVGFLSDAAVYNYLLDCTYFVAFFENGVRSNNTSVNAAMANGSVVITNLDDFSPPAFEHMQNVLDIEQLPELPVDPAMLGRLSREARRTAQEVLGWEVLISALAATESAGGGRRLSSVAPSRSNT